MAVAGWKAVKKTVTVQKSHKATRSYTLEAGIMVASFQRRERTKTMPPRMNKIPTRRL